MLACHDGNDRASSCNLDSSQVIFQIHRGPLCRMVDYSLIRELRMRRPAMVDALNAELASAVSPRTATGHVVSSNQQMPVKRRKVRKGTRSCWECKRRKIRCIFASPEDATCISCQRRRAPCVSQELPEDPSQARKGNRHLIERISRVEDLMKGLVASNDVATSQLGEPQPHSPSGSDGSRAGPDDSALSSPRAALTPTEVRDPIIYLEYSP